MTLDPEFKAHFPDEPSQSMVGYSTDVLYYDSRYVFVTKKLGVQHGYCTHCKQDYVIDRKGDYLKHNEEWCCQHCGSPVVVKSSGMGRKKLFTQAYFVWYEKSKIDPKAIVAMGFHTYRDYENYRETETKFRLDAMYLFKPGHSAMYLRDYWDSWVKPKNIRSEFANSMRNIYCTVAIESIKDAVDGTPFEYSTWERYRRLYGKEDMVHFFDLAARYPFIEYLSKTGFYKCVEAKLIGKKMYSVINWRGKTIEKIVKLSKAELKLLRKSNVVADPDTLYNYHLHKKHGLTLSFEDAALLGLSYYTEEALKLREPLSLITKYALKQYKNHNDQCYYGVDNVIRDLKDYWHQAGELGIDLDKEHLKFPNNLHKAHMDTAKRIKVKVDESLNKKIKDRLNKLNKLSFSMNGLQLRPAQSSIELFEEGKKLKHCVGGYASRYADGQTAIFVLRKASAPDKPFFTVEISNGRVLQCRGFKNRNMTKEVTAFMDAFEREKLRKRTKQSA